MIRRARRTPAGCRRPRTECRLVPENPSLLGRELLVGEDSLLLQGGQVLELLDTTFSAGGRRRRGGLRWGGVSLGRVRSRVLGSPTFSLAPAHSVRDGGGGADDDGGAGDAAKQSWHW